MHREQHHWFSPRLGREMNILVYGHYGQPIVVFPTSGGDEREYAGQGMIDALGHHIEAGRVKFYCVNSMNNESWYDKQAHPRHRSWVQSMYDAYIAHEVAPFIQSHCQTTGHRHHHHRRVVRRLPRGQHAPQAPAPLPPLPGAVGRVRHPQVHGRRLRRQLLLQQPGRLRRRLTDPHILRLLHQCDIRLATGTGPTRTAGRPTAWPTCCARAASRTRWTTGAPTAATTGRTGRSRWTSTSRGCSSKAAAIASPRSLAPPCQPARAGSHQGLVRSRLVRRQASLPSCPRAGRASAGARRPRAARGAVLAARLSRRRGAARRGSSACWPASIAGAICGGIGVPCRTAGSRAPRSASASSRRPPRGWRRTGPTASPSTGPRSRARRASSAAAAARLHAETPGLDEYAYTRGSGSEAQGPAGDRRRVPGPAVRCAAMDEPVRAALYDDLDPPLRLAPGPGHARAHPGPLRARAGRVPGRARSSRGGRAWPPSSVGPSSPTRAVDPREGRALIDLARDAMVTRSRDLDVFAYGDPARRAAGGLRRRASSSRRSARCPSGGCCSSRCTAS